MWTHRTIILPLELAACHVVDDGGHPYKTLSGLGLSLIED